MPVPGIIVPCWLTSNWITVGGKLKHHASDMVAGHGFGARSRPASAPIWCDGRPSSNGPDTYDNHFTVAKRSTAIRMAIVRPSKKRQRITSSLPAMC